MKHVEMARCTYEREGPQVGRNVIAWRAQCKRKVRLVEGQPRRCWQHGGQPQRGRP